MKSTTLIAALILAAPAAALADLPDTANSYSYIEASGKLLNLDNEILGTDRLFGAGLAASFQPLPYAFGFANLSGYRNEGDDAEINMGEGEIGAGLVYPVLSKLDVLATAAFTKKRAEFCVSSRCLTADGSGYVLGAGARLAFNDQISMLAKYENETIEIDDLPDSEESYGSVKLELLAQRDGHGLVVGAEIDEDDQGTYKIGYRYTF